MAGKRGSHWLREYEARARLGALSKQYEIEPFEYIGVKQLLALRCKDHGLSFQQTLGSMLNGKPKCSRCRGGFADTADFVRELEALFPSGYDFSQVVYRGKTKLVTIICERHGPIEKTPQKLLLGRGCRSCSSGISLESFKNRADTLYGEGRFDYSRVEYRIGTDRILLGCDTHGDFYQAVSEFLRGHGCQKCGMDYATKFDGFLARALEVHGDRYSYDAERWNQKTGRVGIYCSDHGWFEQYWWNHTAGHGCNDCSNQLQRLNEHEIQQRLREVHGDRYELKLGSYSSMRRACIVICSHHGEQTAYMGNLLGGSDARCCYLSSARSRIEADFFEWILARHPTAQPSVRGLIGHGLEIDVYLPELSFGIEFNGDYWHSDELIRRKHGISAATKHYLKRKQAADHGVQLVYVWESDWRENRAAVEMAVIELIEDLSTGKDLKIPLLLNRLSNG